MSDKILWTIATAGTHARVLDSLARQKGGMPPTHIEMNNKNGLPLVYNNGIKRATQLDVDWVVFCHDDVEIECDDVEDRLKASDYQVVGVAGTTRVKLASPALWHIMGGGFEGGCLRGKVKHRVVGAHGQATPMTNFGTVPSAAVMIDGVFMAVHRDVFYHFWFDTMNPAKFHFYDLSYSLESHLHGFKVGVEDIPIIHDSPGLRSFTDEWRAGEKWFLERYGDKEKE
jgi:hypothetical protein